MNYQIWRSTPIELVLTSQSVHIWKVSLRQDEHTIQKLKTYLNDEEIKRAERFYFKKDHDCFVISRGSLRCLLARYLNSKPNSIAFYYEEKGKPYLKSPLSFNISHSGQVTLIAIAQHLSLGVDVEYHRYLDDLMSLAKKVFSQREFEDLQGVSLQERVQTFYNGWTRKEAYIKACGKGLFTNLQSFSISLLPDRPVCFLNLPEDSGGLEKWQLYSFRPEVDYTAALAVHIEQSTELDLAFYQWYFT